MKELSLNILDIAQNSFEARSSLTEVLLKETEDRLIVCIKDNGSGMSEETLNKVSDPFYTTRTTRNVGLGIPFFRQAAEQTGGHVEIQSSQDEKKHGTAIIGVFFKDHIDFTPLGDMASTVCLMAHGCGEGDVVFKHDVMGKTVELDTRALREALQGLPLSNPDVQLWIKDYVKQQYENIKM